MSMTQTTATRPVTAPPQPPTPPALGDWLLVFNGEGEPPRRFAPWVRDAAEGTAELLFAPPSDDWRGAPLLRVTTGEWRAWLLGELYGTAQPEAVVTALLDGRAGAETLNGHCLLFAQHTPSGRWHVWTDRFATFHAYYAGDGSRRAALGTYFPAVAAAAGRGELDWEGLTTFFGFGFFANERTYLKGVRALRPATHTVLDAQGRVESETRYWQWRREPDGARSYDDTVDAFAALFGEVMAGLTADGRIALPISGGLDSRSTVATVAAGDPLAERAWAYSYGYSPDSVETGIARRIATARGLRFEAFTIQPYLFDRLPLVINSLEGFQDVTQARQAFLTAEFRRNADAVIAAHLGDLYLDDMGLGEGDASFSDEALLDHTLHKIVKRGGIWLLRNLCAPRLGDPEGVLREAARAGLDAVASAAEPDFRVKAFKVDQWCARWTTTSLRMFQAAVFPRLPFYDTRLSDFFATVPTAYVAGRRLQIDYLRRYAPDLAAITWQETGVGLSGQGARLALPRRAARKGWRVLTGRKVIERNWEVQYLNPTGRAGIDRWLLQPGLRLHDLVAPADLRTLVDAFYAEPLAEKRGDTISMLLTFSAWLELHAPAGLDLAPGAS